MNIVCKSFITLVCILVFPFLSKAQTATTSAKTSQLPTPMIQTGQKLTYKTIQSEDQTWGYEISVDNTPFIRQNSIPGQAGNKGFPEAKQAEATAKLVIEKLKRNESPSISEEELLQIMKSVK